ncbi:MAG: T9SS type A sorting domain-containing protein [Sediminibacterium sp.]|nr:T9SS type A sorting domain-containing protein [Sediminibacterium sp.]
MKKITMTLGVCLAAVMSFGQAFVTFDAPPNNGATTQVRAPNGTSSHTTMRGVFYISGSEMAAGGPTASISSFGFNLTNGVSGAPVTGSLMVYFQLTNDASNTKSTTWATAITGMNTVYNSTMSIPVSSTGTFVDLPLSSAFNYTGGAMYVAYDWVSTGPFTASNTPATYAANNSIAGGGLTAASATSVAPTTLGSTAFRPAFRFGSPNSLTNDISVLNITTPGLLSTVSGVNHSVMAEIRNNSNTTLTNIGVGLGITGAVNHTATAFVPSLGAGSSTMVAFTPFAYTPTLTGVNNITVSVLPDQVNTNNTQVRTQTVNCVNRSAGPEVAGALFGNGIGFNTGSGFLLNRMRFDGNSTVTAVNVAISTGTTNGGNATYAAILSSTGAILATSNTITLVPGNYGTYTTYTFAAPVAVTPGTDYHIGLAQTQNSVTGYFPVASYTASGLVTPPMTLFSAPLAGGSISQQPSSLGFLGFTAVLQGTCGTIGITEVNNSKPVTMAVYPNPASNNLTIEVANASENSTLDIFNTLGQKVISLKNVNEMNSVNVSALTSGVYFVTVNNGKQKATQKLIIEK